MEKSHAGLSPAGTAPRAPWIPFPLTEFLWARGKTYVQDKGLQKLPELLP